MESINAGQRATATGAEYVSGDSDSKEQADEKSSVKTRLAELIPDEFVSTPASTLSTPDSEQEQQVLKPKPVIQILRSTPMNKAH
ncbi:hypothetical protein [Limnohabitans sp. Jir72]|uniref:hypothetical protein n=1 Tax=Limnohabitans sp. Jir72 TaxID=1977909 RepID=UPI000D3A3C2B|nr:hypothetical protein [Limnohabitans sp. Jir72]PUE27972.1 hypothetical protein B9Z52_14970 [Limnohabitans sp. Jir72]